jgi:hypothetical protein
MFVGLWVFYLDSLISHPLLTKCCTSAVGFMLGDSIAQVLTRDPHNFVRTLRFVIIGFFMHAPIADTWFTFLEKVRNLTLATCDNLDDMPDLHVSSLNAFLNLIFVLVCIPPGCLPGDSIKVPCRALSHCAACNSHALNCTRC